VPLIEGGGLEYGARGGAEYIEPRLHYFAKKKTTPLRRKRLGRKVSERKGEIGPTGGGSGVPGKVLQL